MSGKQHLITRALHTSDPVKCKAILTDLKTNSDQAWNQQLEETITTGLRAKFQQNPSLARFLCDTHPRMIGEASPDKKWGIGLTLVSPDVLDTDKWEKKGNLLGKRLVAIREELMAFDTQI